MQTLSRYWLNARSHPGRYCLIFSPGSVYRPDQSNSTTRPAGLLLGGADRYASSVSV